MTIFDDFGKWFVKTAKKVLKANIKDGTIVKDGEEAGSGI